MKRSNNGMLPLAAKRKARAWVGYRKTVGAIIRPPSHALGTRRRPLVGKVPIRWAMRLPFPPANGSWWPMTAPRASSSKGGSYALQETGGITRWICNARSIVVRSSARGRSGTWGSSASTGSTSSGGRSIASRRTPAPTRLGRCRRISAHWRRAKAAVSSLR